MTLLVKLGLLIDINSLWRALVDFQKISFQILTNYLNQETLFLKFHLKLDQLLHPKLQQSQLFQN